MMYEYVNVFLDPLELFPSHELEFMIELIPEIHPNLKMSYRMSPTKLAELKKQLFEQPKNGFIKPSVTMECIYVICREEE